MQYITHGRTFPSKEAACAYDKTVEEVRQLTAEARIIMYKVSDLINRIDALKKELDGYRATEDILDTLRSAAEAKLRLMACAEVPAISTRAED